ncbi:MAG: penicillin-binding transpeptidase domain-containing protein [Collinsella intestinalis]
MEIGGADVVSIGERGHGKISLAKAFALSSNTVFGQVADGLGAEKLVATARAFGYGQQLGLDFTTAASVMPNPEEMTEWELAWAGAGQPVGQGHTPGPQATVMQNALMAATIANNGIAMNPYVVSQILAPDGTVLKTTRGTPSARPWAAAPPSRSSRPCSTSSKTAPARPRRSRA